jgi:phosphohistidine phosphatase
MTAVRFYLVRHARAEPKGASGDAARRLTPEACALFAAHAKAFAGRTAVERIATSPLVRARETAELLAAATGAPVAAEEALAPSASSGRELLALGRKLGAGTALVGHNPELAEAVALAAGKGLDVTPGAIAAIDSDGERFHLAWLDA